jgi:hypothetical protein
MLFPFLLIHFDNSFFLNRVISKKTSIKFNHLNLSIYLHKKIR